MNQVSGSFPRPPYRVFVFLSFRRRNVIPDLIRDRNPLLLFSVFVGVCLNPSFLRRNVIPDLIRDRDGRLRFSVLVVFGFIPSFLRKQESRSRFRNIYDGLDERNMIRLDPSFGWDDVLSTG